ncbi:D-aminoacyl-tRNA deacylase [Fasciola gigantica]|uniref:D-aminoacyl-tRNA deacylase n=1 Tax=Fasciola gigantica TaxID=46835 RepID=A0A504YH55_FASGI|nr:D-aminoacyl-tRNA deacylase [Fasciola gigantica]
MRAIIQRVKEASVTVNGSIVSQIGRGLLVLIGVSAKDEKQDAAYIVRKILNLRLFPNADGSRRWDKSVKDLGFEVLCVSQFTLYTELKGNKLDFHRAMDPEFSEKFYLDVIQQIRENYVSERVKDGIFGAMMDVQLINDGPVTIVLDSVTRGSNQISSGDTKLIHSSERDSNPAQM